MGYVNTCYTITLAKNEVWEKHVKYVKTSTA